MGAITNINKPELVRIAGSFQNSAMGNLTNTAIVMSMRSGLNERHHDCTADVISKYIEL
jgi:hypothetical protein